jgi:hypothetical protein
MAVQKQIWINKLMQKFYNPTDWLVNVTDFSAFVEFNTLNLADIGADPTVYVDNTDWPLTSAQRTDSPLTIPLSTYLSQPTVVRKVEEMELAYDKMATVIEQHKKAIRQKQFAKSAWALGPADNSSAYAPILKCTGPADANGFATITMKDIAALKAAWDLLDLPQDGRILVLHPTHISQLAAQDVTLFKKFIELENGQVLALYGFKVYMTPAAPTYTEAADTGALTKKAFGAAPAATDRISSFGYIAEETYKAEGTYDMFVRYNDPYEAGDIVNFQKRFISGSIRGKGLATIVSQAA